MYLSELFLQRLNRDYSPNSVKDAVRVCNEETAVRKEAIEVAEILDFWDVYKEFSDLLKPEEAAAYEIIRIASEKADERKREDDDKDEEEE